jgi:hypothetical protein
MTNTIYVVVVTDAGVVSSVNAFRHQEDALGMLARVEADDSGQERFVATLHEVVAQ